MQMIGKIFAAGAILALAACGSNQYDRAASGAALGAAAGVAGAAITENDLGTAAILGGVVGAGVGLATTANDIDLGRPVWRR